MKKITVAVVDDDSAFREILADTLNQESQLECTATFGDGTVAIQELPGLKPDVVLMDIGMPAMSGIECLRALGGTELKSHVIMLTAHQSSRDIFEALMAGATGYLLKSASGDEIAQSIIQVHNGGSPISSQIARLVLEQFRKMGQSTQMVHELSLREQEVLKLSANGMRQKEIAHDLGIAETTVRNHLQRIYRKLHVNSKRKAIAKYRSQAV